MVSWWCGGTAPKLQQLVAVAERCWCGWDGTHGAHTGLGLNPKPHTGSRKGNVASADSLPAHLDASADAALAG